MTEWAYLFHTVSDEEDLEDIRREGLKPLAEQKSARGGEDLAKYETVYFLHPDALGWGLDEEYKRRPCVRCRVPKDEVYVADWGDKTVENRSVDWLTDARPTYDRWESGDYDNSVLKSSQLMFLYPGAVPAENLDEIDITQHYDI